MSVGARASGPQQRSVLKEAEKSKNSKPLSARTGNNSNSSSDFSLRREEGQKTQLTSAKNLSLQNKPAGLQRFGANPSEFQVVTGQSSSFCTDGLSCGTTVCFWSWNFSTYFLSANRKHFSDWSSELQSGWSWRETFSSCQWVEPRTSNVHLNIQTPLIQLINFFNFLNT